MEIFISLFQQLCFVGLIAATALIIGKRIKTISRNIKLGRSEDRSGNKDERVKKMLLLAFGQKKMFDRPFIGLMHFPIYAGFLIINIEILEII